MVLALLLASVPAMAARASGGVGTGIPLNPAISPGFSDDCLHRIDPKLHGAALNRAARACRHPDGPDALNHPRPSRAAPKQTSAPADAVATDPAPVEPAATPVTP